MIKILIGASLRQDQTLLEYYWKSLLKLKTPDDTEIVYCFVDDSEGEIDWGPFAGHPIILESDARPDDAVYNVSARTHEWQIGTFEHLARQKQKLIQYAIDHHFNYFFLVDSDLLLEPTTLLSLISLDSPISSAVFWTQWTPSSPPMPQVWLRNPYEMRGLGMEPHEFLKELANRQCIRVIGAGACTLFDTRVFSHCRYHPRFGNLPTHGMWQGEDRTMSITCQQSHIYQFADAWPDIFHAYHPQMRSADVLKDVYEHIQAPRQLFANYGDLVSFEIAAMDIEMPDKPNAKRLDELQKNLRDPRVKLIRGRLGALKIAPEIESALMEMSPGDKRIISIKFPFYCSVAEYAGKTKMINLALHDIKAYGFAPILSESVLGGVL